MSSRRFGFTSSLILLSGVVFWVARAKGNAAPLTAATGGAAAARMVNAYARRPAPPAAPSLDVPDDEQHYLRLFTQDKPPIEKSRQLQEAIRESLSTAPRAPRARAIPCPTIESLECRLRLCRIVLIFDSIDSDRRIVNEVFVKKSTKAFPHGFGAFFAPPRIALPDGRIRTRLYLAREGDLTPPI